MRIGMAPALAAFIASFRARCDTLLVKITMASTRLSFAVRFVSEREKTRMSIPSRTASSR